MSRRGGRGGRGGMSNARLMLQRSAAEAGLDENNLQALQDITRPSLFPDMLWHSSGKGLWNPETLQQPVVPPPPPPQALPQQGTDPATTSADASSSSAAAAAAVPTPTTPTSAPTIAVVIPLAQTKRLPSVTYMTNKQRELCQAWQSSGQYVRPSNQIDVVRYSKTATTVSVCQAACGTYSKLATDKRYFPAELLQETHLSVKRAAADAKVNAKRKKQSAGNLARLEERERSKRAGGGAGGVGGVGNDEDDADGLGGLEAEEAEEDDDEDYTMNYYESEEEDDGGGGDGEPTF